MFANNEIETIEPISEIGQIARSRNILFRTDAAQAVGHEREMRTDTLNIPATVGFDKSAEVARKQMETQNIN